MSNLTIDAGIPVLTEFLDKPATAPAPAASAIREDIPILREQIPEAADTAVAAEPLPEEQPLQPEFDFAEVEDELIERVLKSLQARVDPLVDSRVRDSLADVLQIAVDGIAVEIRQGLHEALKDVVSRAVSDEMARFKK
ncbi:MAG: hypothetical protein K0S28_688 [Paucimonas sp.]|jgi:hypothetical protein|nr:hypothetical protein [Paucimonas sp.]